MLTGRNLQRHQTGDRNVSDWLVLASEIGRLGRRRCDVVVRGAAIRGRQDRLQYARRYTHRR
jgi:hypothetical protein